ADPGAALLIVASAKPTADRPARSYSETLFLPARDVAQEKWSGPKLGPDSPEAKSITGFDNVAALDTLPRVLAALPSIPVYADLPHWNGSSPAAEALRGLTRLTTFSQPQDIKPVVAKMRVVKDAGEIALLRKAADASVAAHLAAMRTIRSGV